MAGCVASTIRYILFVFNFAFALLGITVFKFGLWVWLFDADYITTTDRMVLDASGNAPIITFLASTIIGGATFFVAFLGGFGAIFKNVYMIKAYAVMLFLFFVLEMFVGWAVFLSQLEVETAVQKSVTTTFQGYILDPSKPESRALVDAMQTEFQCCGVNGPDYWAEHKLAALSNTCCRVDGGIGTTCSKAQAWQDGCLQKAIDVAYDTLAIVLNVIKFIALSELIGIVFAWYLALSIRIEQRRQGLDS